jgi:hypothetical protein
VPPQQQTQGQDSTLPVPLAFEKFAGVNTATLRPQVPEEQAYWINGFMPLAPGNLRTLYGIGSALYTASGGKTIVCFYFYNLGATPYVVIFLSDGSAIQVNTSTGSATTVLAASTILAPAITNLGITQYGSQYLIIVANQANGYWVWDGSLLYTAGTLGPKITLTNVGSAYVSTPTVLISGGHGSGATASATVSDGSVTSVTITNPGQGYLVGDEPVVTFSGGTQAGSGASLTGVMATNAGGSGATVALDWQTIDPSFPAYKYLPDSGGLTVTNGGSGYSQFTVGNFSSNAGWVSYYSGEAVSPPGISLTISGGVITGVTLTPFPDGTAANNYLSWSTNLGAVPTFTITDPGGAYVASVTVNNGGSDYSPSTTVTATLGGSPVTQATLKPVISGGVITSVTVLNGGLYGSASPAATITAADSSVTATATVSIMPFGVQGSAVENYQGHVWVFNGNVFNFSAPGSVSDFSTSDGGGSDQSSASYLKVGYTAAVSTNGFLFIIGDSSMDYISGVQTNTPSGGSPTTTYTQNNCDPEVGTPYPAAVTTLGQEILVANPTGIFVSSGGAFVKQSEALDGVFNTVPASEFNSNPFNGFELSAAKATIFGKRVWMVLATIVDPVTNATNNTLLMYNGKYWWASLQDVALTFIQGQEINSVFTAWGTDGTHLYPLFNQPSTAFTKTAQSKLWFDPGGYEAGKVTSRFWSVWQCYNTNDTNITLGIDAIGINASGQQFTETNTYTITGPTGTGYFVTLPQAVGEQGVATGMTITTSAEDMALVSAKIGVGDVQYRG